MSIANNRLLSAAAVAALGLAVAWPGGEANAQAANRNIVIVTPDEPATLEACGVDTSHIGRVVKQNIAETLTEIDPSSGTVKPRLATSWEKVSDTTWRFKLRDGVKFSDGEPFNAENAASSINRTMSKTIECTTRTRFFAKISFTPKAIDANTLEIVASEPVPILPTQMGVMTIVSPKVTREKLSAYLESAPKGDWLMRGDSVAFPPGGCAYLHSHQGPGIRCLVEGGIRIDTHGRSTSYGPGGAWYESGPDAVFAQAAADRPSRFIRVMILPAELIGKSSIAYVNEDDKAKPKTQQYKIYADAPVTFDGKK